MLPLNACSSSSLQLLQYRGIKRSNALQAAVKNRTPDGSHVWKVKIGCYQGLRKIDWITNRSDKSFKRKCLHAGLENGFASEFEEDGDSKGNHIQVGLENGHGSESEEDGDSKGNHIRVGLEKGCASKSKEDDDSAKFQNLIWKKLKAFYTFIVPFVVFGFVTMAASAALLPVQTVRDLSPALFVEILKALLPVTSMAIYVVGVNHLNDVEIDKINKPYLPLASGDFSMETGIAITAAAVSMSLGMAIMLSPALLFSLVIYFLFGSAYSIDLPLLRWKKYPFLVTTGAVISFVAIQFGCFIHIQKYVLGKPIAITKSLIFANAVVSIFAVLFALVKDISDVEGDKAFGVQTLSVKLGKENVFWLSVKSLLMAYGAAVVVGATSSSLMSRLIIIIGHSLIATLVLFRSQSVDLTSKTSIISFYKFLWKLLFAEFFLIPFVH